MTLFEISCDDIARHIGFFYKLGGAQSAHYIDNIFPVSEKKVKKAIDKSIYMS